MSIFDYIKSIVFYAVLIAVLYVIVVVIARVIANYRDLNPFGKPSRIIRRLSDPILGPVRSYLIRRGFKPNLAPLLTIIAVCFSGFFILQILGDIIYVTSGLIITTHNKQYVAMIGFILYGLLALYAVILILRIVFDWLMLYRSGLSRFLFAATEPVFSRFRRIIPPIRMFDISPLIIFILIAVLQRLVQGILIYS